MVPAALCQVPYHTVLDSYILSVFGFLSSQLGANAVVAILMNNNSGSDDDDDFEDSHQYKLGKKADDVFWKLLSCLWVAFHSLLLLVIRSYLHRVKEYTGRPVHGKVRFDGGTDVVMPQAVPFWPGLVGYWRAYCSSNRKLTVYG